MNLFNGMKKKVSWVLVAKLLLESFVPVATFAEDLTTGLTVSKEMGSTKGGVGSEFVSGDYPGAVLMKVNLWGSVGKPGIHYVPTQTDLITLLSYAGGPTENARLNATYIKRWSRGKEIVLNIDTQELLESTGTKSPILQANDVVVIPTKKPIISNDMGLLVSFVAGVLSIIAAGIVVSRTK